MAAELVNAATSNKLTEIDWEKNIAVCELVALDNRQAECVIKAIKKRLGSKKQNTQLYAVSLLEMLMNNIGDPVHNQVIDAKILPILVKIVKKKSELPIREKIFLLLDAAQTSVGGATGRFPQYYSAYYELVSAGVQFTQRVAQPTSTVTEKTLPAKEPAASQYQGNPPEVEHQKVTEFSILQKAGTMLEVLRDVLDAIDTRHPEMAKDEFTLDLVEQCSFQKQRIMQLAMTSRDDLVVSRAIELNEDLHRVLVRHDTLLSSSPTSASNHFQYKHEEGGEEEAEQRYRRLRKGKAQLRPEDEARQVDRPSKLLGLSSIPDEILHRPLIRPLTVEPKQEDNVNKPAVVIPPPPAKHAEREKFFQENKSDSSSLAGDMRGLSLHSRNGSSSYSGSIDFSD